MHNNKINTNNIKKERKKEKERKEKEIYLEEIATFFGDIWACEGMPNAIVLLIYNLGNNSCPFLKK